MNMFIDKIYSKKKIQKLNKKLTYIGMTKFNYSSFLSIRLLFTLITFSLAVLLRLNLIYIIIITIAFYIFFEYFLIDMKIKKRIVSLENDALFFFQVMILSLEIGRNLKSSIEVTSQNVNNDLSNEFKKCVSEMKLGRTLSESLNSLKERIPSTAIKNVIVSINDSYKEGVSLLNALNNQLEYLKDKKILLVKAEINKLPIKMSIASVIFFIPIILLIMLAPVIIKLIGY